ncbi:unnamed protein product [Urochloa humidicola]
MMVEKMKSMRCCAVGPCKPKELKYCSISAYVACPPPSPSPAASMAAIGVGFWPGAGEEWGLGDGSEKEGDWATGKVASGVMVCLVMALGYPHWVWIPSATLPAGQFGGMKRCSGSLYPVRDPSGRPAVRFCWRRKKAYVIGVVPASTRTMPQPPLIPTVEEMSRLDTRSRSPRRPCERRIEDEGSSGKLRPQAPPPAERGEGAARASSMPAAGHRAIFGEEPTLQICDLEEEAPELHGPSSSYMARARSGQGLEASVALEVSSGRREVETGPRARRPAPAPQPSEDLVTTVFDWRWIGGGRL